MGEGVGVPQPRFWLCDVGGGPLWYPRKSPMDSAKVASSVRTCADLGSELLLPGGRRLGFRVFLALAMLISSGWFAYKTIKSGRFEAFGFNFTRAENPVGFLAGVGGWCFLCALFTSSLLKLLAEVSAEH